MFLLVMQNCHRCYSSPLEQFLLVRQIRCSLSGTWVPGWGSRRQLPLPSDSQPANKNNQDRGLNYNIGPKKSPTYDPSYGYEPYWAGGEWVTLPTGNLTSDDEYCNNVCSPIYKQYGTICARNKDGEYKTFENYCQMAATDCNDENKWRITYKGPCITTEENLPGVAGGAITVKNTLAKAQPGIKKKLIQQFYDKYSSPIGGGGLVNFTTAMWTYSEVFTDY